MRQADALNSDGFSARHSSRDYRGPANIAPAIRITTSPKPIVVKKEKEEKPSILAKHGITSAASGTSGATTKTKPSSSKVALVTPNPYANAAGNLVIKAFFETLIYAHELCCLCYYFLVAFTRSITPVERVLRLF